MTASSSDPDRHEYPYAGWIPTAVGRLSFRHLGNSEYPTLVSYANVATSAHRFALAYQKRFLSDVLFVNLIHSVLGLRGTFWFALSATSAVPGDSESIEGRIYIFKSSSDWQRVSLRIGWAIKDINTRRLDHRAKIEEAITERFATSESLLLRHADVCHSFVLHRSGEVFFSKPKYREVELKNASESLAEAQSNDLNKWLANQSYFFLRDICHHHQHHHPASDNIITLHERDVSDSRWRRDILFSLYYAVIRARRADDVDSLYRAKGVHAYATSFHDICEQGGRLLNVPRFNTNALQQSVAARTEEEIFRQSRLSSDAALRLARASNWRAAVLGFAAILIAMAVAFIVPELGKPSELQQPGIRDVSNWLSIYFWQFCSGVFIVTLMVWTLTVRRKPLVSRLHRDAYELGNYRRKLAGSIVLILAAAVLLIILWRFWDAVAATWEAVSELFG